MWDFLRFVVEQPPAYFLILSVSAIVALVVCCGAVCRVAGYTRDALLGRGEPPHVPALLSGAGADDGEDEYEDEEPENERERREG